MNQLLVRSLAIAGLFSLAACGGKQATEEVVVVEEPVVVNASVRVLHAALASGVNVTIGNNQVADGITAGAASPSDTVVPGAHPIVVSSTSGATEVFTGTVELGAAGQFLVVLHGAAGDGTIGATVVDVAHEAPSDGTAHVRFFNAAANAGAVEFTSDGRSYASMLNPGGHSDWVPVTAGAVTLNATGPGATSGDIALSLAANTNFIVVSHQTADGIGIVALAL